MALAAVGFPVRGSSWAGSCSISDRQWRTPFQVMYYKSLVMSPRNRNLKKILGQRVSNSPGDIETAAMPDSVEEPSSPIPVISENLNSHSTDQTSTSRIDAQHAESPYSFDGSGDRTPSLCIAVIGATGELARNKVFPALFALYYGGFLPQNVGIFGYSRKSLTDEDLRTLILPTLTCRVEHCSVDKIEEFLERTYHINAQKGNKEGMRTLNSRMKSIEGNHEANRMFYLSVPQEAISDVASCLADFAQTSRGWNRIILEKPFGFDAISSRQLSSSLLSKFEENQIYRIDHLLGKDLIENLAVLRFSNLVFEPLWSRTHIRNVQIILSEDCGIETRRRYFDGYGIIRDVVHSHILQTIALFAMEPPVSLDGEDIRNEKVKVLKSMRKLEFGDVVLGQHKVNPSAQHGAYLSSLTPTFFAAALYIDNARWDGVPFLIKAGMGLIKNRVEIRIQFNHVPGNIYRERIGQNIDLTTNELILRDAPSEAIFLKINNKVPGLGLQLDASELNLLYRDKERRRGCLVNALLTRRSNFNLFQATL
ncbi:glucose-6-phosphate dehydrogenase 4 isoform X2 [Wolffia australiana]